MPPKTKRMKHLEEARAAIGKHPNDDANHHKLDDCDQNQSIKIQPKQMVVACLLTGTNPTKFRECANMCNFKTCSMSSYYKAQSEVIPAIINVANRTVEEAKSESFAREETKVGLDGCWDSARNGKNCTVTAKDTVTGKTIGYEVVTRPGGNRVGNFNQSSNMMESEGIRNITKRFREDEKCNVSCFVHDGDNKSDKIIKENGFICENERDSGHGFKSLERRFISMKKKVKADNKLDKDPFHGIKGKTLNYAKTLVHNEKDRERRGELWLNVPEHLTGNHEVCRHGEEKRSPGRPRKNSVEKKNEDFSVWQGGIEFPEAKAALSNFCEKTIDLIVHCSNENSTQGNEAQNAMIAREADKNINYGPSYPARVAVAIGKMNDPENFVMDVLHETGIDASLNEDVKNEIASRWKRRADLNSRRREEYEREKITKSRTLHRNLYKTTATGDYNEDKKNFIE